jgi:hypothetical protein
MLENPGKRSNIGFAIGLISLQILVSIVYGICEVNTVSYVNITSVFLAIALAFLTVAGKELNMQGLDLSLAISSDWPGVE